MRRSSVTGFLLHLNVSWRRNDPELLLHTHLVYQDPIFDDPAVFRAGKDGALCYDGPAGRLVAQERTFVCTAHRPVCRKLIYLSDFVLDVAVKIGEGEASAGDQLFEARPIIRHSPRRYMNDTVRRQQLFDGSKIAMVEGFCE